jgi:hypothetical protein
MNASKSISQTQLANLQLGGELLVAVDHIKIIGVILQKDFKWEMHSKTILLKANKGMHLIKKLKNAGAVPQVIWEAYHAFVASHIYYTWPAICDMPRNALENLFPSKS